ncbi:MAG: glutathione-dependent reductase [Betaproteobacteria bacterium RIFCSPLOWO2_02_FULL_65_24]|nr:MAG: glutathione-dependent reductase [Betaproteobacteria bacterium RIFCSPLOWO2_02_FULL_65_24]
MGMLVNGQWVDRRPPADKGRFVRPESQFRRFITADGSSGFKAEPDRYHLYVAYGCPWAHRALIFRKLKGLEDMLSVSIAHPGDRGEGWAFNDGFPGSTADTVNCFVHLHEAYTAAKPDYTGTVTVPTLWDRETKTIVNNESSEIIRMFNSAFDAIGAKAGDYYPAPLRHEIDAVNEFVYHHVNNGVYRTGFAASQEAYDEAVARVFAGLDALEERLEQRRYLAGDEITEADWRLFVTLVRFDAVYYSLFKCNLRRLESYHCLQNYLCELHQIPGIAATVRLDHIVRGYYSNLRVNPNGIIPRVPLADFARPHDRGKAGASGQAQAA